MRFWIYGVDAVTKLPREPLFVEADSEDAARAQAAELGMQVVEVEPVLPRPDPVAPAPPPTAPAAPTPPPAAPPPGIDGNEAGAAKSVTSREQLQALGELSTRVADRLRRAGESFGFRLFVAGCLVVILILAFRIHSRVDELRPPRQGQELRWEYKVVEAPGDPSQLASAISEANRQGWEVVGTASSVESAFNRILTRVMLILRRRL